MRLSYFFSISSPYFIQIYLTHNNFFPVSRHRTLMNLFDKAPVVDKNAFVAPSASLTGEVYVGPSSSIWYGCVVRGMFVTELNIASCCVVVRSTFINIVPKKMFCVCNWNYTLRLRSIPKLY